MDREKVIELFSSCISKGGWNNCTNCEHGKAQAVLTCKPLAEDVLKVLKEQDTVEHALEVLRKAGWTESQDVPFPAELLKEHEAVKPVRDEQTGRMWLCGNCGSYVGFEDSDPHDPNEFDKYCRECGRAVKWK